MTTEVAELHDAVVRIMRALKIAETKLHVTHREMSFVPADIQTLRFLSQNEGSKLSDLAGHLGVVPTTASSIVDRLVDRGMVQRDRPETNRRAIALRLTRLGEDVYGRLEVEELTTMRFMLDALPEEDRPAFIRAMGRIAAAVSEA